MSTSVKELDKGLFEFEGKPSMKSVVPLGLQHVVAAIVGIVTPAMIVANTCKLSPEQTTILVQISLIASAISTLLQLFAIGPIGAKLPLIIGVSFAYIPTLLAIGGQFGLPTILGAQVMGGVAAVLVGVFLKQIRVFFPPLVTGTVIFTIGLSLYPTAIKYMAGGANSPTFGAWQNWLIAIITFLVVVILSNFTKGTLKLSAILIGMVVGYIVSLFMGFAGFPMITFSAVGNANWFQIVSPMTFGIKFEASAIVSMVIMFVVNSVQAIGDISSTTMGGMDREPTDKELSGGIMANGITSIFFAFFGGLPGATYSQNVGIVTLNRVINRRVFATAAGIMLVAGFVPKFSSVLTTIPQAVIGGATISVFATITMTGIRMITSQKLTPRNATVVGLSVALGVGITSVSGCLVGFPMWVSTVFGSSSVVIATILSIALNLILPKDEATVALNVGQPNAKTTKL